MEKHYEKIDFFFGDIDEAVKKLAEFKDEGRLAYCEFNGQKLYSDIDDVDSAYKKVTGKTKTEFDEAQKKWKEDYDEEKRKHEESIPEQTIEWNDKGKAILDLKYHEKWFACVPVRLGDLYRGMELGSCLDLVHELNNDVDFKTVEEMLTEQGHSGMSFGLMCSMLRSFCDRGNDFVEYMNKES